MCYSHKQEYVLLPCARGSLVSLTSQPGYTGNIPSLSLMILSPLTTPLGIYLYTIYRTVYVRTIDVHVLAHTPSSLYKQKQPLWLQTQPFYNRYSKYSKYAPTCKALYIGCECGYTLDMVQLKHLSFYHIMCEPCLPGAKKRSLMYLIYNETADDMTFTAADNVFMNSW